MKKLFLAVIVCLSFAAVGPAVAQSTPPASTEVPHQTLGGLIFLASMLGVALGPMSVAPWYLIGGAAGVVAVNK